MLMSSFMQRVLHPRDSAGMLDGDFSPVRSAPAGTAASESSAPRLSPVVADREGEMSIRLRPGSLPAFIRRHPAVHGGLWGALISIALIVVGVLLRNRLDDPMRVLQREPRRFESRVAGVAYTPAIAVRGSSSLSSDLNDALLSLERAVLKERSPENLHRLATGRLTAGQADAACALLEEAKSASPDDLSIAADLAASLLAAGRVADAAEQSGAVLERDPMHAAAAFTWALAMERYFNDPAALDAWRRYLLIDPDSAWADEARAHLETLSKPRLQWMDEREQLAGGASLETVQRLVAKYPQRVRPRITNILLPQWCASGNPAVAAVMRMIAAERAPDDRFLSDVVEHSIAHRDATCRAMEPWVEAMAAGASYDVAASRYAVAARQLEAIGSPLALAAAIHAATSRYYAGDWESVVAILDEVDAKLRPVRERYPSLEGESGWKRGLVLGSGRSLALGLAAWRTGLAAAERSGEIETQQALRQLIAAALEVSGDRDEADAARLASLAMLASTGADARSRANAYADASFGAHRMGRPFVARAFASSHMTVAAELDEIERGFADLRRSLALLEIGHLDAAAHSIASARARALSQPPGRFQARLLAEAEYAAGIIAQRRGRLEESIESFSGAIEGWAREDCHLHSAAGHFARAEVHRSRGDLLAAERDYRAAADEMEAQRSKFEPALRVSYFERADVLFERFIDLLVTQGRGVEALSVAEQKRARALLDSIAVDDAASPLRVEEIRNRVPAGAALVEVTLLERTAEVWLVYEGRVRHVRRSVSRRQIETAVSRHLDAIAREDETALQREGRWLYEQLFAPVVAALPVNTTLIVVPDGALSACPIAALVTPDGEYLIERFTLPSAPSASVALRPSPPRRTDSMLAVAQSEPAGLSPLRAAAGEAEDAASAHGNGRFVRGAAMTPETFLEIAGRMAWVHFAGHAKTDVEHPALSALIFESFDGAPRELTASRISAARLPSAPFVVLAACSTGRGKLRRNEGTQSLAAAFLQAGARGVVATLWDVEDASSAKLFRTFHEHLRKGARPADALRSAQRELSRSPDRRDRRPLVWASAVVGGTL
jgi:CHAT domain-containing protein